jgi:hypothetical protein
VILRFAGISTVCSIVIFCFLVIIFAEKMKYVNGLQGSSDNGV